MKDEFELADLVCLVGITECDFWALGSEHQSDIMDRLGNKLKELYEMRLVSAEYVESAHSEARFWFMVGSMFRYA